jgi:transcriptional regulator with XRE-family HTH domain
MTPATRFYRACSVVVLAYMAEHVGMDRSFISDLENGRKEICIRNLELLATAFGTTISKLMSRL